MRFLIFILFSLTASTQSYLDYPHPYHPTSTTKGMVVSQNYLSSDIGAMILSNGGNAVDAAVAVGFSLAATLPRAGNLGGGGFMMIYDAKSNSIATLDFRSMSPELAESNKYRNKFKNNGAHDYDLTRKGYKAIAVPGTVAGLIKAHEVYGSMELKDLIEPTISLLKDGVPVTEDLFGAIQDTEYLTLDEESKKIYLNPDVKIGGKLFINDLINTLQLISNNGVDGFYKGETAEKIEVAMIWADKRLGNAKNELCDQQHAPVVVCTAVFASYNQVSAVRQKRAVVSISLASAMALLWHGAPPNAICIGLS